MASGARPSSPRMTLRVPTRSGAVSTRVPSRSKAMTAPARGPAPLRAIDDGGRLVELRSVGAERLAGDADILLGVVEPALLDGLADAGQGLGAVAGEAAGRVDHVHVPGPAGQAFWSQQHLVQRTDDGVQLGALRLAEARALGRQRAVE